MHSVFNSDLVAIVAAYLCSTRIERTRRNRNVTFAFTILLTSQSKAKQSKQIKKNTLRLRFFYLFTKHSKHYHCNRDTSLCIFSTAFTNGTLFILFYLLTSLFVFLFCLVLLLSFWIAEIGFNLNENKIRKRANECIHT